MNHAAWQRKVWWLGTAIVAVYAVLFARAALLQLGRCAEGRDSQRRQSIRRVWVGARRGGLYDRHGVPLNVTRDSMNLCIDLAALREPGETPRRLVEKTVALSNRLAPLLGQGALLTAASPSDVAAQVIQAPALPVVVWRDLSPSQIARWAVHECAFPAIRLMPETTRCYLLPDKGFHVRGFAATAGPSPGASRDYAYCLPGTAGRCGLEQVCDDRLRGRPGEIVLQVDVCGYRTAVLDCREPVAGEDVVLSLDIRLQCYAEEALAERTGAVVVLDPATGDVLAMASSPAGRLDGSSADYAALAADRARNPLLNRAVGQVYSPGSTFKPLVAVAALISGTVSHNAGFSCAGAFRYGRHRVGCWRQGGHGRLDFTGAIEQSCNCAFCEMASRLGPAPIATTAEAFGLGRRTGIELPGEAAGIVPSPEWKRAAASLPEDERRWWPGDTFNLGLGQGYLCVTPLQMAAACAALANGGRLFRPRLILDGSAPPPVSEIAAAPAALAAVRLGMEAVVDGRRGTGREARVEGVRMAAKTGTAQAGTPARPRTWAWMILYAPVEAPRYAVAMVIEDGASGGSAVAPRLGAMMRRVFNAEGQTAEPWLALRD